VGRRPHAPDATQPIAVAARELDEKRRFWLDPPEISAAELKKRTLTNLYNQRPAWLLHAHAALDRAVWAAYGGADPDPDPAALPDDAILERLLALNHARSSHDQSPALAGDAPIGS
jgi:hypothetical protein